VLKLVFVVTLTANIILMSIPHCVIDRSVKQTITFDVIVANGQVNGLVSSWSETYELQWFYIEPMVFRRENSFTFRVVVELK
jgi:hypothetical protein